MPFTLENERKLAFFQNVAAFSQFPETDSGDVYFTIAYFIRNILFFSEFAVSMDFYFIRPSLFSFTSLANSKSAKVVTWSDLYVSAKRRIFTLFSSSSEEQPHKTKGNNINKTAKQ